MNQYSTAQLIGELVKRLEAEGPRHAAPEINIYTVPLPGELYPKAHIIGAVFVDGSCIDTLDKVVRNIRDDAIIEGTRKVIYRALRLKYKDLFVGDHKAEARNRVDEESGCSCCNTDDLAGFPTDDEALTFVAAMALGGTGEFMLTEEGDQRSDDTKADIVSLARQHALEQANKAFEERMAQWCMDRLEEELEHPSDMPVMTFVVTESPAHDPAISHLHAVSHLNPDGYMVQAEISSYCYRTDVPEETERLRAQLHGMICEAADD